mgnify:CR=1 FL=1
MIFYRGNYTQLWLVLTSDEPLGVLDTDFLEDYFGADGFVTLRHLPTGNTYQMPMVAVGTGNTMFRGFYNLNLLPDGLFQIEARVRDPVGNYTILNQVLNPFGNERVLALGFEIRPGDAVSLFTGSLIVMGGFEGYLNWDNPAYFAGLLRVDDELEGRLSVFV